MLEVTPERLRVAGRDVFVAPNGVVLVRTVPADCITGLVPRVRRAEAREDALRAILGLIAPTAPHPRRTGDPDR